MILFQTKFDQNRARRREQILPYVKTEIDLTKHTYDPLERLKHSQSQASLLLRDESRITEKYSKDYIMFGNGSVPNGVSGNLLKCVSKNFILFKVGLISK